MFAVWKLQLCLSNHLLYNFLIPMSDPLIRKQNYTLSIFIMFTMFNSIASSLPADMAGAKHLIKSISSSVGWGVSDRSGDIFKSHGTSFFTSSIVTRGWIWARYISFV